MLLMVLANHRPAMEILIKIPVSILRERGRKIHFDFNTVWMVFKISKSLR